MYYRQQRLFFGHLLVTLCLGVYLLPVTAFGQSAPKIYWIDATGSSIQRSNPNGSGVETIVSDLDNATSLAIDEEGEQVFWCEARPPSEDFKISSIALDGSGGINTLPISFARCDRQILIDPNLKLYYSGSSSPNASSAPDVQRTYSRTNLDGSNEELVLQGDLGPIYGIAGNYIFYASIIKPRRDSTVNSRKNLATGVDEPFISRFKSLGDIVDDENEQEMYFYARNGLYRTDYAGNDIEKVTDVYGISNLDIDVQGRRLFWVASGVIETADLNGNNRFAVAQVNPVDIAFYTPRRKAPIITSTPVTSAIVDELYTYTVEATGMPAPLYSLDAAPEGMEIDEVTGVITWTPEEVGEYEVTVRASNRVNPDAIQSYIIEVTGIAPEIISNPVTSVVLGEDYAYDVEATGVPAPTFSLDAASAGMTIDAVSGLIEWTPDELGTYEVTVVASNGVEPDAAQSYTIEVIGTAPEITSSPVTEVALGDEYFYDVNATGTPDPAFSLSEAPAGMTIEEVSGLIEWAPEELGSYEVTVVASNGIDPDATQSFVVEVTGTPPEITSTPVTSVALGETYTYDVNATGNPAQIFSLGIAPEGMSIDPNSGLITWTPTELGSVDVTVVAANGVDPDATQSFTIEVTGTPPTITTSPVTTVILGDTYNYDVGATGNPQQTFSLSVAPEGMTINPNSGLISWTPSALGTAEVTVVATNGIAPDATQSFTITVIGTAPVITSTPVTTVALGNTYAYDVNATGNPDPAFSLTASPAGMSIDAATGQILWTPSATGSFNVTVSAANGVSPSATQSFSITVTGSAPTIVSTPVTAGMVGEPYVYDVNATGSPAPTYALSAAPNGMAIDANSGIITWSPAVAGTFEVTVVASNGVSPDATQSYSINIAAEASPPAIVSSPVTTGMVGAVYIYDVNATGNPNPTYSLSEAPVGMVIDANSGVISWTPSTAGTFSVTVVASNGQSPNATQSYSLAISLAEAAPVITSIPITTGMVGTAYAYDVNASGTPAPTYALSAAPEGMSIDETSGIITWDPTASGSFTVTVVALNGVSPEAIQSYTLIIEPEAEMPVFESQPVTMAVIDELYVYQVIAQGEPAPTFTLSNAPPGMTINPLSGLITWLPTIAGSYTVTVIASNGVAPPVIQTFTLVVTTGTFAPVITSTPLTIAMVDEAYTYDVNATGNPDPTFALSAAPEGMEIDPVSGVISWTPTAVGQFNVSVVASNGESPNATQSFTVEVTLDNFAPEITSTPITMAMVNEAYAYNVEATGNPDPAYSLDTAPEGMSIDPISGLITWTPTGEGSFDVIVIASNGVEPDATQSYTLEVTEDEFAPVITSVPVTMGMVNEAYAYDVEATGNPDPTYSIDGPPGMEIDPLSGLITWIPSSAGDFEVTVFASNGVLPDASQSFTLEVTTDDFAPEIISVPVTLALVNEAYTYDVEANGNPIPSYSLETAPGGMEIDPLSGVISWVPEISGDFEVSIVVSNGVNPDATQSFTLTVGEEDFAPIITSLPVTMGVVNEAYTYDVDATGNPDPSYSLSAAPAGMVIDALSGVISWTPTVAGEFEITVVASNGVIPDDSQSYLLTIGEEEFAPVFTSEPITLAQVNESYTYDVEATGNPDPIYILGASPEGMSIDPLSGLITWTPTEVGDFEVIVIATNGVIPDATQLFTLEVTEEEFAPAITSEPVTMVFLSEMYTYDVEATGNPGPTYALETAPDGMTVDPISGVISWAPASAGDFEVTVVASNGIVPDASQSFVLTVTEDEFAPAFSSTPITMAMVAEEYTYDVDATGNPDPTYSLETAPEGMVIDPLSGIITWTPAVAGSFEVVVVASNGVIPDATQPFTLTVTEEEFAPTITSSALTMAMINEEYVYDVEATGNPEPTYALEAAPDGMAIDAATGVVTWTPAEVGDFEVTIVATNGVVPDATQSFTLTVTEDPFAPTITSTPITFANVADTYMYQVEATGNPIPTFSLDVAPDDMTIDGTTGVITWVPAEEGDFDVTVIASNGITPDATQAFTITVDPPVGTSDEDALITKFEIIQNYPNPFASSTTIEYSLPTPDHIYMGVYDLLGRQISVLYDTYQASGKHRVEWDGLNAGGKELPAGVYFVKIETKSGESRVMSVMKVE